MDIINQEIEFYEQRLKEASAKLYERFHNRRKQQPKVITQEITDNWSAYHGDSVEVIKGLPSNSIHYSIFSPPFSSLFTYSATTRDMGNSTDQEFYDHFSFLVPELYRIIIPGRLLSFHCSDIPAMKERDGYIGMKDFPGKALAKFEAAGFIYHSKCLIWKDPLVEAVRTKAIGLAHKQIIKDSAMCRNGTPDYIITVRKPGDNPEPIEHKNGFERYTGERKEPKAKSDSVQKLNKFSHFIWQRYASPVWFDIRQGNTLNVQQARVKDDERHICPLQLDAIARCLELWSNPNDIILTPFGGIGSEAYQAVLMGRRAILIELKKSYYDLSVKYLKQAESTGQSKGFGLA